MSICHLSDDLIFASRVTSTARALGLEAKTARTAEQLANVLAAESPRCLLLDLQNPGLSITGFIQALPAPKPFIVGYGSHVDTAKLQVARDAGCDLVLPRSKFVEELPTSLQLWCDAREKPSATPQ